MKSPSVLAELSAPESQDGLTVVNPEPRIQLRVTDVPARDEGGAEVRVNHFQFSIRVPGGETFWRIDPKFGGVISAEQQDLTSTFYIRKWREAVLANLIEEEGSLPPADGDYYVICHAIDDNGMVSKPSQAVKLRLSITSPNAPAISAEAVPGSILVA